MAVAASTLALTATFRARAAESDGASTMGPWTISCKVDEIECREKRVGPRIDFH